MPTCQPMKHRHRYFLSTGRRWHPKYSSSRKFWVAMRRDGCSRPRPHGWGRKPTP